jgi:putative PIN family toxin of toxin-antitoxin system
MKSPPRWVVDTNVLISALLWQGTPGKVFELAGEGDIQLVTSRVLLDELAVTLAKPKLARFVEATGLRATDMLRNYRRLASTIAVKPLAQAVSRDRDDDAVLACALAAHAAIIVTGDDDLLILGNFMKIPILTVAQALGTVIGSET